MAYSKKEKYKIFEKICLRIIEGEAVRTILLQDDMPAMETFWRWMKEDEELSKQYARAKELFAEGMFEDIILISDGTDDDVLIDEEGKEQINHNVIQRDRLRSDNRKWVLSKLNPKKYGDKIDLTTDGEKLNTPILNNDPLNVSDDNGTN